MDLLFSGVTAVTMDETRPVLKDSYVGVLGGKVVFIGQDPPAESAARVIAGRDKVLMPGLINAHTHLSMTLLRGYADDLKLHDWLFNHVFPVEARLRPSDVKAGALLGIAEAIRWGTTSVTDMYMHIGMVAEAAVESGIKANISIGASGKKGAYDFETDPAAFQMREALKTWHNADNGRVKLDVGVHAEYTSFPEVWEKNAAFARENGLNVQVHLSETKEEHLACLEKYKKTPARLFFEAGLFDRRATAAHCVWVTEEDMALMAERGVTAGICPVSNLKLCSGIAPVGGLLSKGVPVALGTDGVCSNNNHDLFEEIKLCALLAKEQSGDPTRMPAFQALSLATKGGAFAQGREESCGLIREGYDADLILLDFSSPQLLPVHNPVSSLCYCARGGDVCLTMVRGRILYENGAYYTIDLERLRRRLETDVMPHLFPA